MNKNLIRKGVFPVYPLINKLQNFTGYNHYIKQNGINIKVTSQRYAVFQNSLKCVTCDIEGSFFAAERDPSQKSKNFHLNLYAINKEGEEVLMTKDHIVPKSLGGRNLLKNYQTMCTNCNSRKGNKIN